MYRVHYRDKRDSFEDPKMAVAWMFEELGADGIYAIASEESMDELDVIEIAAIWEGGESCPDMYVSVDISPDGEFMHIEREPHGCSVVHKSDFSKVLIDFVEHGHDLCQKIPSSVQKDTPGADEVGEDDDFFVDLSKGETIEDKMAD